MKRTRRTTKTFISEASKIHKNKYDYSLTKYVRIDHKITIICPIHGPFQQTPHTHLIYKSGCPSCFQERNGDTKEIFISKSRQVHGDKYDYSLVKYRNNSTKVTIICPIHGPFNQLPGNHINRRSGCPTCACTVRAEKRKMSFDEMITKAKEIHNNKYKYVPEGYTNVSGNLKIICPDHGLFSQRGTNHIYMKQGCPLCANCGVYTGHYFKERPHMKTVDGTLYLISLHSSKERFYKIGITRRSIEQRFAPLKHYQYDCLYQWNGTLFDVFNLEQSILKKFANFKYTPTLKLGGESECFKLNKSQFNSLVEYVYQKI